MDPYPKQRQLIDAALAKGANVPVSLGYGGSRGAAKSRLLRDLALVVISEIPRLLPGIVIYIVRQVWGDLYQNHVQEFEHEHPELMGWFFNGNQEKAFRFPSEMGGGKIVFAYGDTFKDLRRFTRGPQAYMVLIDQAEAFTEDELIELNTPNRWPNAQAGEVKTVHAYNPGGPGCLYLDRIYVRGEYNLRENPEHFMFVQGFGWDNWCWISTQGIMLDGRPLDRETYYTLPGDLPPCPNGIYDERWLASIPDNHRMKLFVTQTAEGRKMWAKPDAIRMGELFGRFDAFAGQAFSGVWNKQRLVIGGMGA